MTWTIQTSNDDVRNRLFFAPIIDANDVQVTLVDLTYVD